MSAKKQKSFNGQVYEKTYKRLNLTPTERIVFQRLLGFLIRNDKPFPYSVVKMADLTGHCKRTIFTALNRLEYLRLIKRIGMGKNRKFSRGSILNKILTTVQNSIKKELDKESTTVQLLHQNLNNRAIAAYKKTSLSLKHKEKEFSKINFSQEYQEYVGRLKADIELGIISNITILNYDDWLANIH